jgi:hypothetical protein
MSSSPWNTPITAQQSCDDRHLALNGKALCNLTIDARSGAFASFAGALRRPVRLAPFNIRHV